METAQASSRVHDEIHQHPACRMEDLIDREVSRIALVDCCHDLFVYSLKLLGATVIVINNSGSGLLAKADEFITIKLHVVSYELTLVMVKSKSDSRIKRKICSDVILVDIDLAVLHILRMNKLDLVDHVHLLKEHGAYESVKITSGNKSFLVH